MVNYIINNELSVHFYHTFIVKPHPLSAILKSFLTNSGFMLLQTASDG